MTPQKKPEISSQITAPHPDDLRLSPQQRLCPRFDPDSIALYPVAQPGEMGFRVVDNCAEEHQM